MKNTKIARVTQEWAQKVVDHQEEITGSVLSIVDLVATGAKKYTEDTSAIRGCFFKVMEEIFAKYNKNFKDEIVLISEEEVLVDFASDKIMEASGLLFEALIVGTMVSIARKEAAPTADEGDA